MAYRVHKSRTTSDIYIRSKEDNFLACFKNGEWTRKLVFNAYELEDLLQVNDSAEAERLVNKAKEALTQPITSA